MKKNKFSFALFFLIFSAILLIITYHQLPQTFFQQDEWQYFGSNITALYSPNPLVTIASPFSGEITHFFPFATLFFLLEYLLFNVNFFPYVFVSLSLHFINCFLVYIVVKKVTKKDLLSFFTGVFFLINSISHQAVSWIAAGIGTLPATTFILLSLYYFLNFLEKKRNKYFFVSLVFLIISLLFKEISLFLFIFYLIFWLLSLSKTSKKSLVALVGVGCLYILLRSSFIFFNIASVQPEIGDVSSASVGNYIYRLLTVSFKGISQVFIPQNVLIKISDSLIHIAYPQFVASDGIVNPYISQSIVFDLVTYIFAGIILLSSYILYRFFIRQKQVVYAKLTILALLFILTSLLPYIFIPGKAGYFSIFEPRNLYIPNLGASLLFVLFLFALLQWKKKNKIVVSCILFFASFFLITHMVIMKMDIAKQVHIGQVRKSFLTTIEAHYPSLPKNVIFYTVSDTPYYGLPQEEKILPVQSGFGRMITVWYQEKENFPACFYENQFLHDLVSEGYRYCEGRGFGYFRDYDKLVEAVRVNAIDIEGVIAYSWNGNTEEFIDISEKIRNKVRKDLL